MANQGELYVHEVTWLTSWMSKWAKSGQLWLTWCRRLTNQGKWGGKKQRLTRRKSLFNQLFSSGAIRDSQSDAGDVNIISSFATQPQMFAGTSWKDARSITWIINQYRCGRSRLTDQWENATIGGSSNNTDGTNVKHLLLPALKPAICVFTDQITSWFNQHCAATTTLISPSWHPS